MTHGSTVVFASANKIGQDKWKKKEKSVLKFNYQMHLPHSHYGSFFKWSLFHPRSPSYILHLQFFLIKEVKEEKWSECLKWHLSRTKGSPKCKQLQRSSILCIHSYTGKNTVKKERIAVPSEEFARFYLFVVSPSKSSAKALGIHQHFNLGTPFPIGSQALPDWTKMAH